MKLAILSDLHLGGDPRYREFTHPEDDFLRLLDAVESSHDRILVPGDVYNLDCARVPYRAADELSRIQRDYPRLTARLHRPPYTLVIGNHDAALARLMGVPERRRLRLGGLDVLMIHGHQFDGLARRVPLLGPTATWVTAWLHRARAERLSRVVTRLGGRVARARVRRDPTLPNDVVAARTLAEELGVDLVVMGHTHRAAVTPIGDGDALYLNGGPNCFGSISYVSFDTETGEGRIRTAA